MRSKKRQYLVELFGMRRGEENLLLEQRRYIELLRQLVNQFRQISCEIIVFDCTVRYSKRSQINTTSRIQFSEVFSHFQADFNAMESNFSALFWWHEESARRIFTYWQVNSTLILNMRRSKKAIINLGLNDFEFLTISDAKLSIFHMARISSSAQNTSIPDSMKSPIDVYRSQ